MRLCSGFSHISDECDNMESYQSLNPMIRVEWFMTKNCQWKFLEDNFKCKSIESINDHLSNYQGRKSRGQCVEQISWANTHIHELCRGTRRRLFEPLWSHAEDYDDDYVPPQFCVSTPASWHRVRGIFSDLMLWTKRGFFSFSPSLFLCRCCCCCSLSLPLLLPIVLRK